jgi:hypothetical protein
LIFEFIDRAAASLEVRLQADAFLNPLHIQGGTGIRDMMYMVLRQIPVNECPANYYDASIMTEGPI